MILRILLASAIFCLLCRKVTSLRVEDLTFVDEKIDRIIAGPMIATLVRLSFHDCVGGCDGCLNLEGGDNKGLSGLVRVLESIYKRHNISDIMSRADFWAYAAMKAVEKGVVNSNKHCNRPDCHVPHPEIKFRYGRKDCPTAPYGGNGTFPKAHMDYDGIMNYFSDEFGLLEYETVALLGAHTLGKAKTSNSGFDGEWVPEGTDMMNNDYYRLLVNSSLSWKQSDITPDGESRHYQWFEPTTSAFMLNSDVALFKDIKVDSTGNSSCTYMDCAYAPTKDIVMAFAIRNDIWMSVFSEVFTKMIEHGSVNLSDPLP